MPELPEVELVAKSLDRLVSKRRIVKAELLREKLAPLNPPAEFTAGISNTTIETVGRRGKHVLFYFDCERILLTHLRMTGRFLLLPNERELPKHSHAVFYFADKEKLVFQDQRHFGMMKLVESAQLSETKELKCLAPEPLSGEFSFSYLQHALSNSKRSLKEFLIDQTKVCGLGNIYAAEVLFLASINPQTSANQISAKRAKKLYEAIRFVLSESINHGSTMNVNPENIDGSYYGGNYEGHWRVYAQAGKPCPSCRTLIERIVQSSRSTFFCPKCQRK
ncbi:MAG: bifunctional DNA-formamidopyrimidine glycosylase/DNA-(apurinic or apyrimidinic site) lyase [Acidobacteriota bacterium]|nr:bifunctional DNA-formamidopyrimidine glycosylase/DNA-(apurinic or apyrimidinic site) lyase [Acidobacteriota bacterium]